jgi:hypothetical protein
MTPDYSELPAMFAGYVKVNLDSLLKSPAQLGAFLAACKIIKEIEPEVRTAAVNLALGGTEIPGFTLVRRETSGYVEAAALEELLGQCPISRLPELLTRIAKMIGNISGDRYCELCKAIGVGVLPNLGTIKHAGANPFLRENHKNGKEVK